jgi:hypothetical protein
VLIGSGPAEWWAGPATHDAWITIVRAFRRTGRRVSLRRISLGTMTRTNLPISATTFVARVGEIERVTELLGDGRLLTLSGSGGCGKTRLALEVARRLESDFVDGVWLVELAQLTDPEFVVHAVAAALNVREVQGQALLATLCTALQEKRLLLILDNCEHLVDACARLANALLQSCRGLHIRHKPRGAGHCWRDHLARALTSITAAQPPASDRETGHL